VASVDLWERDRSAGRLRHLGTSCTPCFDLADRSIQVEDDTVLSPIDIEDGTAFVCSVGKQWLLCLDSGEEPSFTPEMENRIELIARYAETALSRVRSRSKLETARQEAEQERRRLREIIDHVPHFIFAKNADGEFLLANRAVADAYGTTTDAIEGQTDADFSATGEEADHFISEDRKVIESGEPRQITNEQITDADGDQRTLNTWKIPFESADEPAVLGVSVDITELQQTKDTLQRLRERDAAFELLRSILSIGGWEEAMNHGTKALFETLDSGYAAIYEWNEDDGALVPTAVEGDIQVELPVIKPGSSPLWDVFVDSFDEPTVVSESLDEFPSAYESVLADTVNSTNLIIAGLATYPTDDRLAVVETVTSYLRAALEHVHARRELAERNATLEERTRELRGSKRLNETLKRSTAALVNPSDRHSLKQTVAERLTNSYSQAGVVIRHPNDTAVVAEQGRAIDNPVQSPLYFQNGIKTPADEVKTTGTAVYVPSIVTDERFPVWRRRVLEQGYQSCFAVPLNVDGIDQGVLELYLSAEQEVAVTERGALEQFGSLFASVLSDLELRNQETGTNQTVTITIDSGPLSAIHSELTLRSQSVIVHSVSEAIVYAEIDGILAEEFEQLARAVEPIAEASISSDEDRVTAEIHLHDFGPLTLFTRFGATIESVTVRNGRTEYTMTVSSSVDLSQLVESAADRYGEADLVRKLSTPAQKPLSSAQTALSELLTDRQREVLEVAVAAGYYDQPRAVTGDGLADQLGVSRQTVNHHLRRGEGAVLQTVLAGADDDR